MQLGLRRGCIAALLFAFAQNGSLAAPDKSETSARNQPDAMKGACAVVMQTHDGFLAVRAGPGTQHAEISRIFPGQIVVTDNRAGQNSAGAWRRINATFDGIGQPERRIDGWVHSSFLTGVNC
jgi:hypothetical protein